MTTLVGSSQNNAASGSTIACTVGSVAAGDTVVVWVNHESAQDTDIDVSDGTTELTKATLRRDGSDLISGQFHYLLSSVATGSVTYTATFDASKSFPRIHAFVFRFPSTPSFLDEAVNDGSSASAASGTFDANSSDAVVLGGFIDVNISTAPTSEQINGVAADAVSETGNSSAAWYRIITSGFTGGQATCSNENNIWICCAIAIGLTAEYDQEGFRWRNDDGSESTASWKAAQDTAGSITPSTNVRLRVLLDRTDT